MTCSLTSAQVWKVIYENSNTDLFDIFFIDSLDGWVVGNNGTLLHSIDGGNTWNEQQLANNHLLQSVHFINNNEGWIAGSAGIIYYTQDGGLNWINQNSNTSFDLRNIFFINDSLGWVVGGSISEGVILKTNNKGVTWNIIDQELSGSFLGVFFINDSLGWVVGGSSLFDNFEYAVIWHTADGGLSWEQQFVSTPGPLAEVKFINEIEGWAVGWNHNAVHTTDGGTSWNFITVDQDSIITNYAFSDLITLNYGTIKCISQSNIYHSIDGGTNWVDEFELEFLHVFAMPKLSFVDYETGWAIDYHTIYKYSNDLISITHDNSLPKKFTFHQNYPNPFNPATTFRYNIPENSIVNLTIYDLLGRQVRTLINQTQDAGNKLVIWNATNDNGKPVSAGVYLYKIQVIQKDGGQTGEYMQMKKMILMK